MFMAFPLVFINGGNGDSDGYSWYVMQTLLKLR